MDQIQNGQVPEFLQGLISKPAAANQTQQQELEALVKIYPQCSIFHLLLAKASQNADAEIAANTLQSAAVHAASREVLFKLMYQSDLITAPKQEKVYPPLQTLKASENLKHDASFMPEISLLTEAETIISEENLSAKNVDASFNNEKLVSEAQPVPTAEHFGINPNIEEAIVNENDLRVEDVGLTFVNELSEELVFPTEEVTFQHNYSEKEEPVLQEAERETAKTPSNEIDEEVFDEIMAIEDISFNVVKTVLPAESQQKAEPEIKVEEKPALTIHNKAEKDMLSSIASIDYFTFNKKFGQNYTPAFEIKGTETQNQTAAADKKAVLVKPDASAQTEPETVSKYHDDKMPYTFMWWLDKTRKEYAGTYQPYVKNQQAEKATTGLSVGPELHQQYIESIFHTKPPHGLVENSLPSTVEPPLKRKEDVLIERFIIEEPHIHPPSSDKLDTENKAKKSSEDGDILVTETLAKIYFDQMLYHKALDTYKKLVLKFPEKSRYFTAQIDLLEKKIN